MVHVWSTKHVMKWGEINNVREWGRFKVHHKADRNEILSAFSGTLRTSCIKKKIATRWMMCWWMKNEMECEWRISQAETSSKVSVRRGDSLGRIGLKEKVGFHMHMGHAYLHMSGIDICTCGWSMHIFVVIIFDN